MRGSFDALAGHVRRLRADPLDGHLYLFVNRRKKLLKAIWFDRSGWALYSKRLEKGTFKWVSTGTSNKVAMTRADLSMLLEGIDLKAGKLRPHFADGIRINNREDEG